MVFPSPGGCRITCLSKGTGSALKCKIVVPSAFQVAPCCWLCSQSPFSIKDLRSPSTSNHFMWSSAAPAALPWPRPTHWATQLQCDAATILTWHAAMKENISIIQVKVPNCMHKTFLTKHIPKHQITHNKWIVPCTSKHLTCTSCGLRPRLRRCLDHVQIWLRKATANCNAMLPPC